MYLLIHIAYKWILVNFHKPKPPERSATDLIITLKFYHYNKHLIQELSEVTFGIKNEPCERNCSSLLHNLTSANNILSYSKPVPCGILVLNLWQKSVLLYWIKLHMWVYMNKDCPYYYLLSSKQTIFGCIIKTVNILKRWKHIYNKTELDLK